MIAQPMSKEDFKARKAAAMERLNADAKLEERAGKKGGASGNTFGVAVCTPLSFCRVARF